MPGMHSDRDTTSRRGTLRLTLLLVAIAALAAVLLPNAGSAGSDSSIANTGLPGILGSPVEDLTLTATNGSWSGSPTGFAYGWLRCPPGGGAADGSDCGVIPDAGESAYRLAAADVGFSLRVAVTASNDDGPATAVSNATAIVTSAPLPGAGCPSGDGPLQVAQVVLPAQLLIDQEQVSPNPVTLSAGGIVVRVHISACGGRSVEGALVYVTAVPYNQFSIPAEAATDADGWASLNMQRLSGFPAASQQQLLVMFIRARKLGDPLLSGISARRLVASHVDLTSSS